jgi:ketosteroid isomerase-like protein
MIRSLAPLALLLAFAAAPARGAEDGFAALADRIRQAEERDPGIPMDPGLYAAEVTYGHAIGEAHTSKAADLLAHIGPEQASFKRFVANRRAKLTRFVAGGDTVVAETEMSGTLPDQTRFDTRTAIFFTIAQGRIVRMELWAADPMLGRKFAGYMETDPDVIASRQAK